MSKVKTQEEYNQVEKYLVAEAIKTLGISEKAAKLRVKAIVKSGILSKFGTPDQIPFQVAIDAAMQIPQLGECED
jgi:hypothetical protein